MGRGRVRLYLFRSGVGLTRYRTAWTGMPYLQHIKSVSKDWPHLQILADFMQVSRSPLKWDFLPEDNIRERAARTRVAMLTFYTDQETTHRNITCSEELIDMLQSTAKRDHDFEARLFIVEDLSRSVIEALGNTFDIDPLFFRNQMNDYLWYNIKDPWVEMPDLAVSARHRSFFTMRYVQTRYLRNEKSFKRATAEAGAFNVFRRPDNDSNRKGVFDGAEAMVVRIRSRMSFWTEPTLEKKTGVVGEKSLCLQGETALQLTPNRHSTR